MQDLRLLFIGMIIGAVLVVFYGWKFYFPAKTDDNWKQCETEKTDMIAKMKQKCNQKEQEAIIKFNNSVATIYNLESELISKEIQYQDAMAKCKQDCILEVAETVKQCNAMKTETEIECDRLKAKVLADCESHWNAVMTNALGTLQIRCDKMKADAIAETTQKCESMQTEALRAAQAQIQDCEARKKAELNSMAMQCNESMVAAYKTANGYYSQLLDCQKRLAAAGI